MVPGCAHIIVIGNEKGGSGKSTTALHIIVSLLKSGLRVGVIDLDARQKSLTRYLDNRRTFMTETGVRLLMPDHRVMQRCELDNRSQANDRERQDLESALADLATNNDIILIDCPGADTNYSRLAHARADTIVTPINDSLVDLDLIARIKRENMAIEGPSLYAEMVWQARKSRAMMDRGSIDWVVCRNRTTGLNPRNKRRIGAILTQLSRRIGFRFTEGLAERVIYKELFLQGLTLLDLKQPGVSQNTGGLTMSQVAARQEVRRLVDALNLPHMKHEGLVATSGEAAE